jgi:predicted nucleic acid-binding Zn ribbon protein
MTRILNLVMPRCPKCAAPLRFRMAQDVQCGSCGTVLEDDRVYNLKLYFVLIFIVIVLSIFLPIYLTLALIPVLIAILVRQMRFVEKSRPD